MPQNPKLTGNKGNDNFFKFSPSKPRNYSALVNPTPINTSKFGRIIESQKVRAGKTHKDH